MAEDVAAADQQMQRLNGGERFRRRLIQGKTFVGRVFNHPTWAWARVENFLNRQYDRYYYKDWRGPAGVSVVDVLRQVAPATDIGDALERAPSLKPPASTSMYGNQDGSRELVNFIYAYCLLAKPDLVAETGVAHGFSTAAILHALAENQQGALISIDLPQLSPDAVSLVGKAVPQELRNRWTLHLGPANRLLSRVLPREPKLDLFLQDAAHTVKGQLAEFRAAWPFLRDGGLLVADDVTQAFEIFGREVDRQTMYLAQPKKATPIGILMR